MSLANLFQSLIEPDKGKFTAIPINSNSSVRIARNGQNQPCILFVCRGDLTTRTNINLQFLKVYDRISCTITESGQQSQELFTVIVFKNNDTTLQSYFLQISEALLGSLSDYPSFEEIIEIIYKYIEVLRLLTEPPRKSVQGLWAELLLISESHDVTNFMSWWHNTPEDRFDFNTGAVKLEVKSALGNERIHHFSLAQLSENDNPVIIISVLMRLNTAGICLDELRQKIARRLNGNLILLQKLDVMIARTLGNTVQAANEITYDYNWAKSSIRCYQARSIPKIEATCIPEGVSDIKLKVDLNYASEMAQDLSYLRIITPK